MVSVMQKIYSAIETMVSEAGAVGAVLHLLGNF
jgi:hypothetical protein